MKETRKMSILHGFLILKKSENCADSFKAILRHISRSSGNNIRFWGRGSDIDMLGTWSCYELWYEVLTCNNAHNFTTTYVMNINPNLKVEYCSRSSTEELSGMPLRTQRMFHIFSKLKIHWVLMNWTHDCGSGAECSIINEQHSMSMMCSCNTRIASASQKHARHTLTESFLSELKFEFMMCMEMTLQCSTSAGHYRILGHN